MVTCKKLQFFDSSAFCLWHFFNSSKDSKLHCSDKTMFSPLLKDARVYLGFCFILSCGCKLTLIFQLRDQGTVLALLTYLDPWQFCALSWNSCVGISVQRKVFAKRTYFALTSNKVCYFSMNKWNIFSPIRGLPFRFEFGSRKKS